MAKQSGLKLLFFVFNFVLWLTGCALLAVGIWMKIDKTIVNYVHVVNLHHTVPLLDHAALLFLVVGGLTFLAGLIGCCGILRDSQPLLFAYATLLLLLMLTQIAASVMTVLYRKQVEATLQRSMAAQVSTMYMGGNDTITQAWDYLQIKSECCGVMGPSDFINSTWWINGSRSSTQYVPTSCCVLVEEDVHSPTPENPVRCQSDARAQVTESDALHTQGCYPPLGSWFHKHSVGIIAVGFSAVLIQLIGIVIAIRLRNSMATYRTRKN